MQPHTELRGWFYTPAASVARDGSRILSSSRQRYQAAAPLDREKGQDSCLPRWEFVRCGILNDLIETISIQRRYPSHMY